MQFENGLSARIFHDPDVEQPFACDDALRIVVLHRRYIDPSGGDCGETPDEVAAWERENARQWFSIPLFLYDHSGTIYRVGQVNPFHCRWDSGRVGIIALKRSEWGDGEESGDWLADCAQRIAEEYTSWANGECYGYVLSDAAGREIESCGGFIGLERVREQAAAAAGGH
jgi:hypothetical protein